MSESIIARRGNITVNEILITSLSLNSVSLNYVENSTFMMPANVKNNTVEVTLVGGSGGNGEYAIGSKGEIVTALVELQEGETVDITVGKHGSDGQSGGITSFGIYAYANGGSSNATIINEAISSDNGYAIINYILNGDVDSE